MLRAYELQQALAQVHPMAVVTVADVGKINADVACDREEIIQSGALHILSTDVVDGIEETNGVTEDDTVVLSVNFPEDTEA